MAKWKHLIFYTSMIVLFGGLMFVISRFGEGLEALRTTALPSYPDEKPFTVFKDGFIGNLHHPLAILIIQIVSIIVISRIFSFIFNKIGQPTVIGEIIAGIILGPSVVGLFFPEVSGFLFPKESLGNLQFLSQVGLILFMFVIGMELDTKVLRHQANDAIVISHTSIVFNYALGMGLAFYLYQDFAPSATQFLPFALFMGIAMSITAFPVLARVIQERGLTKTRLGTIAITCAASDDITAWCILAAVIAIVKAGTFVSALFTIGMAIIYVVLMLTVVRPFLKKLGTIYNERETISKTIIALLFVIMLGSAYMTEIIGIHALFGAFLAGVIMPETFSFRKVIMEKIEDVSVVLLLPLFFVFTGLRTQIGLLNDAHLWAVCGVIVFTAVAGKFGGSAIAARVVGQSWKDSLSIGALMNTRGLMELIVLNIGYDLGILSPEVFAMMVLMALVTTFMTGPLLNLINFIFRSARHAENEAKYKILIAFGPAIKGKKLLRLADQITHQHTSEADITAFHLTPSADINPKEAKVYEEESFRLVRHEAQMLGVSVKTLYKASNDINKEITGEANRGKYDLLLVGGSRSVFSTDVVGGKVKNYLEDTTCQLGVLVDKDFEVADRIVLMLQDYSDLFLISFAEKFIINNSAKVVISDPNRLVRMNSVFSASIEKINKENPESIEVSESHQLTEEYFNRFNLFIISYYSWKHMNRSRNLWLAYVPSTLILKPEGKLEH